MPASTKAPDPSALLAGLRKALAGPRPLTGKTPDALFVGGKPGQALVEEAVREGLLVVREIAVGKKRPTPVGELTEKGRKHVLEADSPKSILEALLPAVEALATQRGPESGAASPAGPQLERVTAQWEKVVEDGLAKLQKSLEAGLGKLRDAVAALAPAQPPGSTVDPAPVLEALRAALTRVEAPAPPAVEPAIPTLQPDTTTAPSAALEEAVVAFVRAWEQDKCVGCPLDALMVGLRSSWPALSIGGFHDALRKLHESRRIRLSGWPKSYEELPEPELALFISSKVMYYANPAQHG